jgi:uncharacterized membrane protein YsdA (DUF1294 family)/cold shock CspA family protein
MRQSGKLRSWNGERGFGFIEPAQDGKDIFVPIKAFPPGSERPTLGQVLSFEVELGPNGKKRALSVQHQARNRVPKTAQAETPASWSLPQLLAIPAFASLWLCVASRWPLKPIVLAVYIGLSLLACLVDANDKTAAIHGHGRTPEKTLHLLSVAGGWPGALLAQQLLRHKCSKPKFVHPDSESVRRERSSAVTTSFPCPLLVLSLGQNTPITTMTQKARKDA